MNLGVEINGALLKKKNICNSFLCTIIEKVSPEFIQLRHQVTCFFNQNLYGCVHPPLSVFELAFKFFYYKQLKMKLERCIYF